MSERPVHTIADIARLAGVSKATVSRALNDSPLISAETKERVRSIAKEHRFQMNAPARRLSLQASSAIAFITYDYGTADNVPDSFVLELMSGISTALHGDDYDLLVVQVEPDDTEWPRRYLETGRADGFILTAATCKKALLRTLVEGGAPFAIWGISSPTGEFCSVTGDSVAGGRIATAYLLGSGRSRIGFLGGPAVEPEVKQRYEGYAAALADAGHEVDPELVVNVMWHRGAAGVATAVDGLLGRAPDLDAIFANSDNFAIAAMDALRARGRRVPDDVAVVGYDDVAVARHANPPLTTIRQSGPLIGRLLAENLLQHLRTGAITSASIPAELIVRESA